ncbi:MAG: hypothetical protein NT041_00210 [Candidatus Vogelbacteria bacterium]|nr:hypothetical protein [Candidatus Vogelbacteria bacterium]
MVASSSEITTFFHPRPIVINEIGWAGTVASGFDEWLELKSCFHDYSIDLSSYYLTDSQRSENWRINLTDKILPKGYYLIERGDDNVISNRPKNLVESFITNSGSKAFNLASIGLKLWHKTNLGDELVDETPVWNKAGSASSSLERTFENKISTELSTWEDNFWCYDNESPCALDRNATTTFGTPGQKNKASTAYQS